MARVTLYPTWENNSGMSNVNGNSGIYREMEDIQVLADPTLFAHWGNEVPGNNYQYAVSSVNGGKYKPSQIEVWNFHVLDHIPENARITEIKVEWAYAKFAYSGMGHGSFGQPVISIPSLGLNAAGNAPPKDVVTDYNVSFSNLKINASDLSDVHVTFDLPMNSASNPCYVKMKYLRLNIEYVLPNYIPSVVIETVNIEYGQESRVFVEVIETNNVVSDAIVPITITVSDGLNVVSGSISGNYTPNTHTWNAKLSNGKAKLTFNVTPSAPSISGTEAVNAFYYDEVHQKYNQGLSSLYITPQKAELIYCNISPNAVQQSLESNHYVLFDLEVENKARTPLQVYIDFDNLQYVGNFEGYDQNTKILTITDWDANNLYVTQLQLYNTTLTNSQVIVSSDAWNGVTRLNVEVNEEFDYEEYYTELDVPLFTLSNMDGTNGKKYVFGCLVRVTGTDSIINGVENARASVINGVETFTKKATLVGEWELLYTEFTYNEAEKLSFRFYGNYVEYDEGKVEFGNLFLIESDYFFGYEYPALSFEDLSMLVVDDGYTNLLLEPPESVTSCKHYFDNIDWMGLSENKYLVVHGLEVTGDVSCEEKCNVLVGFGHTGIDELDYYTTSVNLDKNTQSFKLGGKFETFGLRFSEVMDVLDDIQFYIKVDDAFDNVTPINIQMKNVRIKLYYSMDSTCWEFFINGESSKHFLLDLFADSDIPRGAKYDVNKFKVDGADGEYPNRINLEENKIKLKFTTCECGTIEELNPLLEKVVEWLYPERDSLDNPILKTISFFYAPDVGYDYYIKDKLDAEAVDGAYECEVELIVPSGLAHNIDATAGGSVGTIGHMGKVKPVIYFNLLSHDGDIILLESETQQKIELTGEFIDNLPLNTSMKVDCENKKLYYEAYDEWFSIDPNCITMDSTFFTLNGHYDFSSSVNVKVSEVIYYELKG